MILGDSSDQGSSSRVKISDAGLGRCEPVSLGRGYGQWRTLFGSLSAHLLMFAISAFPFPLLLTWDHTALFVSNVPLATRSFISALAQPAFQQWKRTKRHSEPVPAHRWIFFLILNIFLYKIIVLWMELVSISCLVAFVIAITLWFHLGMLTQAGSYHAGFLRKEWVAALVLCILLNEKITTAHPSIVA